MTQPSDLEARVSALETQVGDLAQRLRRSEQDAAAARVLAGGADRDVSEIRTEIREFRQQYTAEMREFRQQYTTEMREFRQQNTQVLNALRQDMFDGFARVDERFARVDDGFAEMRGKIDATAAGLQVITGMLTTLIDQQGGR